MSPVQGLSAFSGLVGALIGEIFAGPVIDQIAKNCERKGQEWYPERRLKAIWLGFATAIVRHHIANRAH